LIPEFVMRSRLTALVPLLALAGCQDKKTEAPPPVAASPAVSTTPGTNASASATGPVAGTIMGKPFTPDQVLLEGKSLSFRKGKDFFPDMEIKFDLPRGDDKKPAPDEWKLGGGKFGDPAVHVSDREGKDLPKMEFAFGTDYTMTLRFTKRTAKTVEGVIDLKMTKPANTNLAGTFTATVKKTATDPLDADDAPYVRGKVTVAGPWKTEKLSVGFVGKGADGNSHSNHIGSNVTSGEPTWMTNSGFEPQITSLTNDEKAGLMYRHTKVPPGEYWVYAKRGDVMAAWKKVTVKAGDQLTEDLTIDPAKTGELVVTLPDAEVAEKDNWHLSVIPTEMNAEGLGWEYAFNAAEVKAGTKTVTVKGVPAGKYHVVRGQSEADVEVVAGKSTKVDLIRVAPKK
jgi:hypothetical protein